MARGGFSLVCVIKKTHKRAQTKKRVVCVAQKSVAKIMTRREQKKRGGFSVWRAWVAWLVGVVNLVRARKKHGTFNAGRA